MVTDLANPRADTCVGNGGRPGAGLIHAKPSKTQELVTLRPSEYQSGDVIENRIN